MGFKGKEGGTLTSVASNIHNGRTFSANVLKPNLEKKKTVAIPDVDDFDDQVSHYNLHLITLLITCHVANNLVLMSQYLNFALRV